MTEPRAARLLLFNLATDADDPILGFTHEWLRCLATRVAAIDVVTMRAGRPALPDNVTVHSVGKEHGYSEVRRAIEFSRIAARLRWFRGYDGCFAHMMPVFAVMAAPILRARGIPITLWYTHRATTPTLRLAVMVSRTVITAAPDSINVRSAKVVATGHGVDTSMFRPDPAPAVTSADARLRVLSVSRVAPIKNLEVLVDAAARLRDAVSPTPIEVVIAGPVAPADDAYAQELQRRASSAGLGGIVALPGPVPRDELPGWFREATVFVNLSPQGLFDKASLEGMSCGTPIVTTNPSFRALLGEAGAGEYVVPATPDAVAAALRRAAELDAAARADLGRRLREVVVEHHSLDRLADRLTGEILFR